MSESNSFKNIPLEDRVKYQDVDQALHADPDMPNPMAETEAFEAVSGWRAAKSILVLRDQVNTKFPHRDKSSDGIIGDEHHCHGGAPSSSDHCPWVHDGGTGVVTAFDITNDPAHCDSDALAQKLLATRDERIKYIISKRRIVSSYPAGGQPAWVWRNYTGPDPHTSHLHLSVNSQKNGRGGYDDTTPWAI
jgi:hypothetical protein